MKIPKYIEKMISDRCKAQCKANALQIKIDNWMGKHDIECMYSSTYIGLYSEPNCAEKTTIEAIKNK